MVAPLLGCKTPLLGTLVAGIMDTPPPRKRGVRKEGTTPAQAAAYAERTRKARDRAIKKLRPQIEMLKAKLALDASSPSGLIWVTGHGRSAGRLPAGTLMQPMSREKSCASQ